MNYLIQTDEATIRLIHKYQLLKDNTIFEFINYLAAEPFLRKLLRVTAPYTNSNLILKDRGDYHLMDIHLMLG